jgi:trans-aconitate methyltransferase
MDWTHWLQRWDSQQEAYIANREERFDIIGDVVAWVAGDAAPRVLDLGAGPGSLSVRLHDRFPGSRICAVDRDPVTQLLGQRGYGDCGGSITWIDADLTDPSWTEKVRSLAPFDAAVSTTALHWLSADALARLYQDIAELVRPGGAFVNGDHLRERPGTRLAELTVAVRAVAEDERELWEPWWEALEAEAAAVPELAEAFAERARRSADHPDTSHSPGFDFHLASLRIAGFTEVGTVWQHGDDRVLVALR